MNQKPQHKEGEVIITDVGPNSKVVINGNGSGSLMTTPKKDTMSEDSICTNKEANYNAERSVEEIVKEVMSKLPKFWKKYTGMKQGVGFVVEKETKMALTQTLQAERQKREEAVEAERERVRNWVKEQVSENGGQCIHYDEILQALTQPNNQN